MAENETAVILGATRGLGREIATLCEGIGLDTVRISSSYRNTEYLEGRHIPCDLLSECDVARCVDKLAAYQSIDYFFWVAGRLLRGRFSDCDLVEVRTTLDLNLRNPLPIIQRVWRTQQSVGHTQRFIAIASTAADVPKAEESIYVASKAGQAGFVRSLAHESNRENHRVLLALPSGMKTGFWEKFENDEYHNFSNPEAVARRIFEASRSMSISYAELRIPRGTM